MKLLVELVRARERGTKEAFDRKEKISSIKQIIDFLVVEVLGKKTIRIWNRFKMQLKDREYYTICDYEKFIESRMKVLICHWQCQYKDNKLNLNYYERIDRRLH